MTQDRNEDAVTVLARARAHCRSSLGGMTWGCTLRLSRHGRRRNAVNIDDAGPNLLVARAHEDLAYSLYVYDYHRSQFQAALSHAERALAMMRSLVPKSHLLMASACRVKALIIEEVGLDTGDESRLLEAEELHKRALQACLEAFGEEHATTAKHYGNLGRLYQSLKKYKDSERLLLKAISIKERVLGSEDIEVALSLGHLASLYVYDTLEYRKAEEAYLRAIAIGQRLMGDAYSGLEYDYRGLIQVYSKLGDVARTNEYSVLLSKWRLARESMMKDTQQSALATSAALPPPEEVEEALQSMAIQAISVFQRPSSRSRNIAT